MMVGQANLGRVFQFTERRAVLRKTVALGGPGDPPAEEVRGDVVHARGFPSWGPPTLCGHFGPVPEVCGEVTCPGCFDILGDGSRLAARAEHVRAHYGEPQARGDARSRVVASLASAVSTSGVLPREYGSAFRALSVAFRIFEVDAPSETLLVEAGAEAAATMEAAAMLRGNASLTEILGIVAEERLVVIQRLRVAIAGETVAHAVRAAVALARDERKQALYEAEQVQRRAAFFGARRR